MSRTCTAILLAAVLAASAVESSAAAPTASKPSGFIHANGTVLRDGEGRELRLRGVNLGGWLLWEGWIWGGGFQSESTIRDRLAELVGQPAVDQFQADVRKRYISEGDIADIARSGMNVVRVPFNSKLLEDEANPGVYKEAGWRALDDLLASCKKHGVYVVLTCTPLRGDKPGSS